MVHTTDDRPQRHPPIEELVRHVVAAHLECSTSEVRPRDDLEKDLGITRLGVVLIGLDLEDVLDVALPFETMDPVRTVADLARVVAEARRTSRGLRSDGLGYFLREGGSSSSTSLGPFLNPSRRRSSLADWRDTSTV
jgi:acyl carrier protein